MKKSNSNKRTFYKMPDQHLSKLARSSKSRKVREMITAKGDSGDRTTTVMWRPGWDPGTGRGH